MAKKVRKAAAPKTKNKKQLNKTVGTWIHVEEEIIIAGGGLIVIVMVVLFLA